MRYIYYVAMQNDIHQYIEDHVDLTEWVGNREGLETVLCDELWTEDSVTGNGSGSYTFDRQTARKYVTDNMDFITAIEHDFDDDLTELFCDEGWERLDVLIRCYLLERVVHNMLKCMEFDGVFGETA